MSQPTERKSTNIVGCVRDEKKGVLFLEVMCLTIHASFFPFSLCLPYDHPFSYCRDVATVERDVREKGNEKGMMGGAIIYFQCH